MKTFFLLSQEFSNEFYLKIHIDFPFVSLKWDSSEYETWKDKVRVGQILINFYGKTARSSY